MPFALANARIASSTIHAFATRRTLHVWSQGIRGKVGVQAGCCGSAALLAWALCLLLLFLQLEPPFDLLSKEASVYNTLPSTNIYLCVFSVPLALLFWVLFAVSSCVQGASLSTASPLWVNRPTTLLWVCARSAGSRSRGRTEHVWD